MNKTLPLMTAGAMFLSGAGVSVLNTATVFAEEAKTSTDKTGSTTTDTSKDTSKDTTDKGTGTDTSKDNTSKDNTSTGDQTNTDKGGTDTGDNTGDNTTDTTDADVQKAASDLLTQLKAVDAKGLTNEQASTLAQVITELQAAIDSKDTTKIKDATTKAAAALQALSTPSGDDTQKADNDLVTKAQDVLDKGKKALDVYRSQWSDSQIQKVQDLLTALQTAITSGDSDAIQKAMDAVNAEFTGLNIDLNNLPASADDIPKQADAKSGAGSNGTATNAGVNTGLEFGVPAMSSLGAALVSVGGLTYKVRKHFE